MPPSLLTALLLQNGREAVDFAEQAFGPAGAIIAIIVLAVIAGMAWEIRRLRGKITGKDERIAEVLTQKDEAVSNVRERKDERIKELNEQAFEGRDGNLSTLKDLSGFLERIIRVLDRHEEEFSQHERHVRDMLSRLQTGIKSFEQKAE